MPSSPILCPACLSHLPRLACEVLAPPEHSRCSRPIDQISPHQPTAHTLLQISHPSEKVQAAPHSTEPPFSRRSDTHYGSARSPRSRHLRTSPLSRPMTCPHLDGRTMAVRPPFNGPYVLCTSSIQISEQSTTRASSAITLSRLAVGRKPRASSLARRPAGLDLWTSMETE